MKKKNIFFWIFSVNFRKKFFFIFSVLKIFFSNSLSLKIGKNIQKNSWKIPRTKKCINSPQPSHHHKSDDRWFWRFLRFDEVAENGLWWCQWWTWAVETWYDWSGGYGTCLERIPWRMESVEGMCCRSAPGNGEWLVGLLNPRIFWIS